MTNQEAQGLATLGKKHGDYCRENKKYESSDYYDFCRFIWLKGTTKVYIGFTF